MTIQISNPSGLRAVGKAVLCKPYHPEITASIIAIPDHVKSMELMNEMRAEVIQVGAWCWNNEPEPRAKPGDKVLIQKFCGAIVKGTADGEFYRLCNDQDIFCLIETGDMATMIPEDPVVVEKRIARETQRTAAAGRR